MLYYLPRCLVVSVFYHQVLCRTSYHPYVHAGFAQKRKDYPSSPGSVKFDRPPTRKMSPWQRQRTMSPINALASSFVVVVEEHQHRTQHAQGGEWDPYICRRLRKNLLAWEIIIWRGEWLQRHTYQDMLAVLSYRLPGSWLSSPYPTTPPNPTHPTHSQTLLARRKVSSGSENKTIHSAVTRRALYRT